MQMQSYCLLYFFRIVLFTIWLFLGGTSSITAQQKHEPYAGNVKKQRLLLHTVSGYLFTISQGQVDLDSTLLITSRIYGLSPFLIYSEGLGDGKPTPGSVLLEAGKVSEAEALLITSKNSDRIKLLLELGSFYLYRPGSDPFHLKQASRFIQQAIRESDQERSPTWKAKALTLHAFYLNQSRQGDESFKTIEEVINYTKKSGNKSLEAQAHLDAAQLLPFGHPSRMAYLVKSLALFKSVQAHEKTIQTQSATVVEHFITKRFDKAEQCLHAMLKVQQQIQYQHNQYAYDVLAYLADIRSNYSLAMEHANKSHEYLDSKSDSVLAPLFYSRKATIFSHVHKDKDAFAWYDKALEGKTNETRLFWYKAFFGKVLLLNHHKRPEEALMLLQEIGSEFPPVSLFEQMHFTLLKGLALDNLRRFGEAEVHYGKFLAMVEHFPTEFINVEFPQALVFISRFYSEVNQTKKARELLEKTRRFLLQQPHGSAVFYDALFKIDSTEGRYLTAVEDLQHMIHFSDSAESIEQRKKTEELVVQYETEKKDKDIQLLKQEGELQQARLDQFQFTRNITFAGATLLLFIAGLLYYLYVLKQKSNKQLTHLLNEKEWLLKEIHHRVKNNLHTILSLLESQSRKLSSEASNALQESQNRVYAMSLIHKKLYQSTDVSSINMEDYLRDLVQHLRDSFGSAGSMRFSLQLEAVELDVSQAVPVGLIVNEAITNSIKYAFPGKTPGGEINVSLKRGPDNKIILLITDNGIGMANAQENTQSLGLKLIRGLTEDIDGTFSIEIKHGVTIIIEFVANIPFQKMTRTFASQLVAENA